MKLIGMDSSGLVASVAVVEDDTLLAEYSVNYKKTHSQTLLPMLDEVRNMLELDLETVDAIAIAAGPGSFTGLRIGSATVKGMGMALNIPVVEVPTLEGLAFNLWGTDKLVCPIMDARRQQVYAGIYAFEPSLSVKMEQTAIDVKELAVKLNEMGREVIFLGDGVPVYRELLQSALTIAWSEAPASCNRQSAASIATLGGIYYKEGRAIPSNEHSPVYLRKSQAENEGPKNFTL